MFPLSPLTPIADRNFAWKSETEFLAAIDRPSSIVILLIDFSEG